PPAPSRLFPYTTLFRSLDLPDRRWESHLHADLALHEDVHERTALARARVGLGRPFVDHLLDLLRGREVLRGFDGDLFGITEGATAAPEPHRGLRLGFFGSQRHAVAGDPVAEVGDLLRRFQELIPVARHLGTG